MPAPFQLETGENLASILVRLSRERDVAVEHLQAEQLIRDAQLAWPGAEHERWLRWLREASECVSLRARVAELPLHAALELCQDGALVVGGYSATHGVTVLLDFDGSKARVASGEIDIERRLGVKELADRLDDEPTDDQPRQWLVVEHPELSDAEQARHLHHKPLRRLVQLMRPEWPDIWVLVVFAFFAGVLSLATPIAVEALVNTVAFGRLLQPIIVLAAMLFGFLSFAAIMRALQTYVAEIIQRRLFARVAADLAYRLPRVEHDKLAGQYGPELVNRFLDVVTLQKVAAQLLLDGVAIVLATLVGMTVLAFYHPWLLGFDVLLLLLIAGGLLVLGRGGIPTGIDESKYKYRLAAWFEDLIRCERGFKIDGGSEFAIDRANLVASKYLRARRSHFSVLFRQLLFILTLQVVAGTVLLGGGGWLVVQGQLSLGQLVAAELIVTMILSALGKVFKHLEGFFDLVAAVDKLGVLFDLSVERHDGLLSMPPGEGLEVNCSAISFRGTNGALRNGLTLQIESGERVALWGPRDSGKSRLAGILFGLGDPDGGHIEIGQCDPRDVRPDVLRSHVCLVSEIELFEGSLAENIDLQRPGVRARDVRNALAAVGMLDDVLRMEKGIETPVNASGSGFSSTQLRLLMLARAIAGQPRVMIVDGLLDSLPDRDLELVLSSLTNESRGWTLLVTTGRRDIATCVSRWIDLSASPAADHRMTLVAKGERA